MDPSLVYLKHTHGNELEFPNVNGEFNISHDYQDGTVFNVISNGNNNPSSSTSTQSLTGNSSETTSQSQTPRRSMCVVKISRADVGSNGKPANVLLHNHTLNLNIYSPDEANVPSITDRVRDKMSDQNLTLVNNNCLELFDQEGTRGNNFNKFCFLS